MVGSILHSSFLVVLLCRSVLSGDVKCKTGIGSEKGMILEKKETFEIAKCAAIFCSTIDGKYQWNEWYATYPNATKEECLNDTTSDIVEGRTEHNLPIGKWTDWVCTCQFGASGVDMANAKFEPPTES
ncbi:hypothetical protein niasHT_038891 [Heterodera trifolii]|uniref:Secreted protein n=1 Tax=Heterodera trifolii TaxID=157864 RepID=A0ABD2IK05_9BILA